MIRNRRIVLSIVLITILIFGGSLSLLPIKSAAAQEWTGGKNWTGEVHLKYQSTSDRARLHTEDGTLSFQVASDWSITGTASIQMYESQTYAINEITCAGSVNTIVTFQVHGGHTSGDQLDISFESPVQQTGVPYKITCSNGQSDTDSTTTQLGSFSVNPVDGGSMTRPCGDGCTETLTIHVQGSPTSPPQPAPQPTKQCDPDQARDQNGKCVNLPVTFAGPATQVVGDVKVQLSDGSWKQIKEGDVISEVRTIKTGPNSWVTINSIRTSPTFYDNSMVALGENSEFQPGQNPKLIQGYLWIYENHSRGACDDSCSVISSLLAKINVKGTDFMTLYYPYNKHQLILIKEGSLDVTLLATGQTFHYNAPWEVAFNSTNELGSKPLRPDNWNNGTKLFSSPIDVQTIPEFGPIAPVVLAISILSIIVFSMRTRRLS